MPTRNEKERKKRTAKIGQKPNYYKNEFAPVAPSVFSQQMKNAENVLKNIKTSDEEKEIQKIEDSILKLERKIEQLKKQSKIFNGIKELDEKIEVLDVYIADNKDEKKANVKNKPKNSTITAKKLREEAEQLKLYRDHLLLVKEVFMRKDDMLKITELEKDLADLKKQLKNRSDDFKIYTNSVRIIKDLTLSNRLLKERVN